jgi:hypothetical protein
VRRFLVVAVVGVLAACGGGGGGGGGSAAYVDAAMRSYDDADADVKEAISRDEAECLVQNMVDIIGVDNLEDAGIEPGDLDDADASPFEALGDDMTEEQSAEIVDVIVDGECFDMVDVVLAQIEGTENPFGNLSEEKVRCVFDGIFQDPAVKEAMAGSLLGDEDADSSALSDAVGDESNLFKILGDCDVSPSQLAG